MITTVTMNTSIDKLYLVDSLEKNQVMRVKEVTNTAGGKGLNVSKVAACLGEEVCATGFVGGFNGDYLISLIGVPGVKPAFTKVQAETRSCINIWDSSTGRSTEFLEPGQGVTQEELSTFETRFLESLKESSVVTISGSVPAGVPKDYYKRLVDLVKAAGKQVLVDSSGELLKNCLSAKPTMIKPNTDEIRQILDVNVESREDIIQAASTLYGMGIPNVAVSLGKEGVVLVCEEGVFQGIPPKIEPVNTVGCGDSMVAGFAVALSRGLSVQESIRLAVAVSAANALTKATGSFLQEDLQCLLPQVQVLKL